MSIAGKTTDSTKLCLKEEAQEQRVELKLLLGAQHMLK
jgi:hypothetical protein